MRSALIMAGGRSERMRASSGHTHKALINVLGVPMIERNLCALLTYGFDDIIVATNEREFEITAYVQQRGSYLARANQACVRCYIEPFPLGTIGAAGQVEPSSESLLVVNVDNLTTLNLSSFVDHHESIGAALSIATHIEPFRIPFGQVMVEQGRVLEYREKPFIPVHLSSGTYVLGNNARRLIPGDRRTDAPELVSKVIGRRELVASFGHNAAWIDVNDARSVQAAEELIEKHADSFERLVATPRLIVEEGSAGSREIA